MFQERVRGWDQSLLRELWALPSPLKPPHRLSLSLVGIQSQLLLGEQGWKRWRKQTRGECEEAGKWVMVGEDSSPSPCREPGADADGVMDPGQPWGAKAAVCGAGLGVWVGTESLLFVSPTV